MDLDSIAAVMSKRLPTAPELIGLCEALGIGFGIGEDGAPRLKVRGDNKAEGLVLAKLLNREPWRSQVIAAKGLTVPKEGPPPARPVECLWPGTGYVGPHSFPENGWPTGAYFWRHAGEADWRPIPGRTWDAEKRQGTHEQRPAGAPVAGAGHGPGQQDSPGPGASGPGPALF